MNLQQILLSKQQEVISMEIESGEDNSLNNDTKSNPQGGGQSNSKDYKDTGKDIEKELELKNEIIEKEKKQNKQWGYKLQNLQEKSIICNLTYKQGPRN